MGEPGKGGRSVLGTLVALVLKTVWGIIVFTTPLLGVWGASSLAAYKNGPIWLAILAGLALFPLLPVGWELGARWWRKRRLARKRQDAKTFVLDGDEPKGFLTTADRVILRTLVVNLVFIGGLLTTHPEQAFEALSTRGDWMLEGRDDPTADGLRHRIFWAADRLEWLYVAVRDNPFREFGEKLEGSDEDPAPAADADEGLPTPGPRPTAVPPKQGDDGTAKGGEDDGGAEPQSAKSAARWPMPAKLHPVVASLPAEAEESIDSVARYIAAHESDPFLRVKALHDYAADRVAYDAEALVSGNIPPQDAETTFRKRKSVCAGYATLLAALGKAAGAHIVFVPGDARTQGQGLGGGGHAWNAAKIEGQWYLLDATWNSGSVAGTTFTKGYRTDYLFTPPKIFALDHLPDKPRWQLLNKPLSRGEFLRQPMMSPGFYAQGFELLRPRRSQVSVSGFVDLEIANPKGMYLLASYGAKEGGSGSGEAQRCKVERTEPAKVHCELPSEGRYAVKLFANAEEYGTFGYVGQLEVNNQP
ncbi:MAG: transglutaminase [Deltaproteobacteria bacterium]|nr:MAG: transglutaminase [Deltaproteobacteria bacterium]